jgi:hypothetical protein
LTFGLLIFVACNDHADKRKIQITDSFLQGEWMVDSIVGKKGWVQDWVYFTDDKKFWRFSEYRETYLLDKELNWKQDSVFNQSRIAYIISPLDSEQIILDNGKEKFHCKRWMPFDREKITKFLEADPVKRKLNGWWILDSADTFPIQIPSWCDNLGKGTKFNFNSTGKAEIYPVDTTSNKYCDSYIYKIYGKDELSFQENDLMIPYNIIKLDENELILKGRFGVSLVVRLKRQK